jgi:hypothetical protein
MKAVDMETNCKNNRMAKSEVTGSYPTMTH